VICCHYDGKRDVFKLTISVRRPASLIIVETSHVYMWSSSQPVMRKFPSAEKVMYVIESSQWRSDVLMGRLVSRLHSWAV
jgi:hypothetical protein